MELLRALTVEPRTRIRRFVAAFVLAWAAAAFAAVGLAFATWALFLALRVAYGVGIAAASIAALYLLLSGALLIWRSRVASGKAPERPSARYRQSDEGAVDGSAKQIASANAAQAAALGLGAELTRQMTPAQLVLFAALTGFVAGRKS